MKLILFIALLFLVTAGRVQAVQLTLDECIEKALQGNSGLKIYETEVTAGEEEVKIARAALFPSVRVKALYSLIDEPERLLVERDAFTSGIPAQDVELTTGNRDFYNVSLIVEQPLFTGGRLEHSVGKSKTIEEEATIAVQRQRKLLRGKVRQAFYDLLNASLSSDFARKIADAKQERLRVIRERHREGYSAADEVARQLRLRDIGGQIIIDFIEMKDGKHLREVEKVMRQALKIDRARTDVSGISPFGLMELVRQRLGSSAISVSTEPCPCCGGTGIRRNLEWQALQTMKTIHRLLRKPGCPNPLQVPVGQELAIYMLNNKRELLTEMGARVDTRVEIVVDTKQP